MESKQVSPFRMESYLYSVTYIYSTRGCSVRRSPSITQWTPKYCHLPLDETWMLIVFLAEVHSASLAGDGGTAHHSREARQLRSNIHPAFCRSHYTMYGISSHSKRLQVQLPTGVSHRRREHR